MTNADDKQRSRILATHLDGAMTFMAARPRGAPLPRTPAVMTRPAFVEPSTKAATRRSPKLSGPGALLPVDDALRSREARFRAMVQNGGEIIVIIDLLGVMRYSSPAFERILGYAPGTFTQALPFEVIHPDDVHVVLATWEAVIAEPARQHRLEYRTRRSDGEWVWLDGIFTNLIADPDVNGIVLNARDMTERRATELALAQERDILRLLMDNLPDHVYVKDLSSRFIRINNAGAASLGAHSPADVIGKMNSDFGIGAEDASLMLASDTEVLESGKPSLDRLIHVVKPTGDYWFSMTKAPTFDAEGTVTGLVGITRDVTERMRSEAALRTSEANKAAVLEAALDAVMTMDADGRITEFNPAAERIFGHRREEMLGMPFDELLIAAPQTLVSLLRSSEQSLLGHRRSVMAVRADGEIFPAELVIAVVHSEQEDGRVAFAGYLRDVTDAQRFESELRHLALHDGLTGLPNRVLFDDRLDQLLKQSVRINSRVAILFIDLDRFKLVNDEHGHAAGDEVLKMVADRMQGALRSGETVARFGGDEFIVLLEGVQDAIQAERVADRLLDAVSAPLELTGASFEIGLSIGIALSSPGMVDAPMLLHTADAALYRAKALGGGNHVVATPGMADESARRRLLEGQLRWAVVRGELEVHYQPIIDLATNDVRNVEALLRWRHPTFGLMPAAEFIPLAEETGAIVAMGAWMVRDVVRQLAVWGPTGPSVAVNLSVRELREPGLAAQIAFAMKSAHVEPVKLTVEVTESILIADIAATIAVLEALRASGIRIAIDDFGTGYSSLSYLRDLPVDSIKLDRSFVRGLGSHAGALAMVEGIVSLAHALELAVTAEGIETAEQLAMLRQVGCDQGQGYLLARPSLGVVVPPMCIDFAPPLAGERAPSKNS